MRKLLGVFVLLLLTSPVSAMDISNKSVNYQRFMLFAECKPMFVSVELNAPKDPKPKFSEKAIRYIVESRFRAARLYRDSQKARNLSHSIYVGVNVSSNDFYVWMFFSKLLYDDYSKVKLPTTTWQTGVSGKGRTKARIFPVLSQQIDKFIAEFLRVNEKACNKRWKR